MSAIALGLSVIAILMSRAANKLSRSTAKGTLAPSLSCRLQVVPYKDVPCIAIQNKSHNTAYIKDVTADGPLRLVPARGNKVATVLGHNAVVRFYFLGKMDTAPSLGDYAKDLLVNDTTVYTQDVAERLRSARNTRVTIIYSTELKTEYTLTFSYSIPDREYIGVPIERQQSKRRISKLLSYIFGS